MATATGGGKPVVSFLEVDGKLLSGEEFDEYCKSHGLCRRCARVRTHRRVVKVFGKGKKWEPLTVHSQENPGEYLVYKGYCLRPTCYTMGQAKRLLGEGLDGNVTDRRTTRRKKLSDRLRKRRPSRRVTGNDDASSVVSDATNSSNRSAGSFLSGISQRLRRGSRQKRHSTASSSGSVASSISSIDFSDDDTIDSSMLDASSSLHGGTATTASGSTTALQPGQTSPIVQHRVEQLVLYDYFTVLDLSKVQLRNEEIAAIVEALQKTTTLESIVLDKCKLADEGLERIVQALRDAGHVNVRKLSLRQNSIGNRGAIALEQLLRQSPSLEELDMSENAISSRGAVAVFSALHHVQTQSPDGVSKLVNLNLAQNEIWDLDDGSFLRSTKTLQVLNLDGNFMHDEGTEQIAAAICENADCRLEKLYLGWNGISDDGATAIAKMMEINQTIQVIGLAENDISNTGARAILSALSINTSVREISGLYHNQIDRKFIIVAIKRLLHRYGERNQAAAAVAHNGTALREQNPMTDQQKLMVPSMNDNDIDVGDDNDDQKSQTSDNSLNWAAQLYSTNNHYAGDEIVESQEESHRNSAIALEAIEHWDWGTFGIEEIESSHHERSVSKPVSSIVPPSVHETTSLQMPDMDDDDDNDNDNINDNSQRIGSCDAAAAADAKPHTPSPGAAAPEFMPKDRLTVFQSAPLAYFNRVTAEHHAIQLTDMEYERQTIRNALADPETLGSDIDVRFETATVDRLQNFFVSGDSPIMHLSCFGSPDCFALENGFGYMQAIPASDLRKSVSAGDRVQVVVVSSHHSHFIAQSLLKAGIPHVVRCQTDAVFRDAAAVEFAKLMYQELARNSTLQAAFHSALEGVQKSSIVKNVRDLQGKFQLLPEQSPGARYHDVPIFFEKEMLDRLDDDDDDDEVPDTTMLPPVPTQFIGREVDMYEILESLRVDDVVRVGGAKGSGKASIVSAVSRYILARPKSFMISNVFWLPPPPTITPDEDSLYGDLCHAISLLLEAEEDIWDEEDYSETRERIMIELEGQKNILVVDGRKFTTEVSGENLERFLGYLLNEASIKIILITATELSSNGRTRTSRSEETMVSIGALDFKSSALLFGSNCRFVSSNGCPAARSPEEFAAVLVPPSVARSVEPTVNKTQRQRELYMRLGNGNPRNIMEVAKAMSESDFTEVLRIAQRPEVHVDSAGTLEAAMVKYACMQEKAVKRCNFRRAQDLSSILEELESLKSKYSSLSDLLAKERGLKRDLTAALAKRQYEEANSVKRKLLALKKVIMKEKSSQRESEHPNNTNDKLAALQAQMSNMLAIAEKMKMEKSLTEMDASQKLEDDSNNAIFSVEREDHKCELHIYHGDVLKFKYSSGLSGLVAWTNEACELTSYPAGEDLIKAGGLGLTQDIGKLPSAASTEWGAAKIGMGEAVMLGPRAYGILSARFVILAVAPLSPTNDDDDWDGENSKDEDSLHFTELSLRSSYRSVFTMASVGSMEAIAVPMITSKEDGEAYERTLAVGLQTTIDEAKFTDLQQVHLVANSSGEATKLIKMALAMGLTCEGTS